MSQDNFFIGSTGAQADFTYALTPYADVTGAWATVPAQQEDPQVDSSAGYLKVTVNGVLSKATGGSATIGVFVNGAVLADTERTVTSAQGAIPFSQVFYIRRANAAAQIVKLQVKCSDTNTATVSKASVAVERIRVPGNAPLNF